MEHLPKNNSETIFDNLSYDEKSIHLYEMADSFFMKRNIPNDSSYSGERSYRLEIVNDKLLDIAPIFDSHLIDAPDILRITFTNTEPLQSADSVIQDVLIIATQSGDLHMNYFMWYTRNSNTPVDFTKDAVRKYESPTPYKVGPFECEAERHDVLYRNAALERYDMNMLYDLLMYLTEKSV